MPTPEQKPNHSTTPSPGLLRQLLGDAVSDRTKASWPELEKQWAGRQIEMPGPASKVNRIGEMGWLQRQLNPNAYASTSPLGTIALNRQLIEGEKQDLGDVLAHEMTHVNQGGRGWLRSFTEPDKVENEAINAEAMRPIRRGDIELRAPIQATQQPKKPILLARK